MSKWDLDTPALVLDLDKLEKNIAAMRAYLSTTKVGARPHAKTHKSAEIAKMQIAAGAVGVCTAKLGEAEALFAEGVQKICMLDIKYAVPALIARYGCRLTSASQMIVPSRSSMRLTSVCGATTPALANAP